MNRQILRTFVALLASSTICVSLFAQPVIRLDEYKANQIILEPSSSSFGIQATLDIGSFEVDNSNREEVRAFFNAIYWASEYATIGWTGSFSPYDPADGTEEAVVPGLAGDTSDLFKEAVLLRINYYRAMAGISADVVLEDDLNEIAQLTAIIMGGNDDISHTPVLDGFTNYITAVGNTGAGDSNLAIGSYGPDSVNGYMQDKGVGNFAVGHRRWLLYPPMVEMGTGDTPSATVPEIPQAAIDEIDTRQGAIPPGSGGPRDSVRRANAIHIFSAENDVFNANPRAPIDFPYVAFPQEGYVPYRTVHPRWSFSIEGANFKDAVVTMTKDGVPMDGSDAPVLETLDPDPDNPIGFIGDNTLVWVYDGLDANDSHTHEKPSDDVTYSVTITGIQDAPETSYTYDVIVFDPEVPTTGETTVTSITGPAAPEQGILNEYAVDLPDFAQEVSNENVTGIRFRSFNTAVGDFVEGAESGIGSLIVRIFGGYNVIDSSFAASGTSAFHLATSSELGTSNSITFPDAYVVGSDAMLSFESMVRTATDTQLSKVNISLDNGVSWINVFLQPGTTAQDGSGGSPETTFTTKDIDLSEYEGRTIHIQFEFDHIGGIAFPQTTSQVGWYFDDITLTNVLSMTDTTTSAFLPGATTFDFAPAAIGDVSLQAQGMMHDNYEMEWGTVLNVSAVAAAETVTANDDTNSITEGGDTVGGDVLANDDKPDGETLVVDQVGGDGANVGVQIATTYGQITIAANGTYTYTLDNTNTDVQDLENGESLEDSVTYRAKDGEDRTDVGTLRITINGLSVIANDDEDSIDEGESYIKGNVTDNDGKPADDELTIDNVDGETDNVGTRIKTDHGYLVIAPDGSYAYQVDKDDPDVVALDDGETLEETFTYTAKDSDDNTSSGVLRITINGQTTVSDPTGFARVVNISSRSEILTNDNVMIAGFTVLGTEALDVLIMSVGPTLAEPPNNLTDAIANPTIELYKTDFNVTPPDEPTSALVDHPQNPNTTWGDDADITTAIDLVGAPSLPLGSNDAAMRVTVTEGVYTAVIKGVDGGTGIGTVEVYDETHKSDFNADVSLFNISTRSFVGSEDSKKLFAGFTVLGNKPQKVLIRAQGPGLALPTGSPALPNPNIRVLDQTGTAVELFTNDDWGDAENNVAEILLVAAHVNSVGYTFGSTNSAMVVDLEPNKVYGVQVAGAAGESGIALIEVFAPTDL